MELRIVATVLTACGIETERLQIDIKILYQLQQYLPLAVLKRNLLLHIIKDRLVGCNSTYRLRY